MYRKKIDAYSEAWRAIEERIGGDLGRRTVEALKELYSIYDSKMIKWMASLYDPATGAWYYSKSAQETDGYGPDAESTIEVFGFWESTGMTGERPYAEFVPDWLKKKTAKFCYGLQDPDGYFYHPQWPKEYINARGLQSRITRDRGSAITVLRKTGFKPLYATSDAHLTERLPIGTSESAAVSKVIATAVLSQFESVEAFRAYIDELDREVLAISDADARAWRLYAIGNEFQSTVSLVKANPEYVTILHEFFKKHQNPDMGTWSSVLTYNATNSLHKIGYVYNSLGLEYDYMEKMIDTIIAILSRDAETDPIMSGVDCANAWAALKHIYTNIRITSKTAAVALPSTVIEFVSRLTEQESTSAIAETAFSTLAEQAAQNIPVILNLANFPTPYLISFCKSRTSSSTVSSLPSLISSVTQVRMWFESSPRLKALSAAPTALT